MYHGGQWRDECVSSRRDAARRWYWRLVRLGLGQLRHVEPKLDNDQDPLLGIAICGAKDLDQSLNIFRSGPQDE